jgi:cyclic pyranopterin phosphate synthase
LRIATAAVRQGLRTASANAPALKRGLRQAELGLGLIEHTAAQLVPGVIRARPRRLTIAITAFCNLRCTGCRYGRDFMTGEQLTLREVCEILDDARAAGIELVRFYGGEPLLHPELPAMVRHALSLGLSPYVTTNGILLKQKVDALFDAGLRDLTIGFYGVEDAYDQYVGRPGRFRRLEAGLEALRERYGKAIAVQLNFLIMRPSCDLESLRRAWAFAERFDLSFHTDLVHYSLPYFTEGPDRALQFTPEDRPAIELLVRELVRLKEQAPERVRGSLASLRSIPDWLLKGPAMRVPCDAGKLVWIGADGSVQLCYVTFKLGNIREQRLASMLFTDAHHQAARDAFKLACPNCHCERNERIQKHLQSRLAYGRPMARDAPASAP